MTKSNSINIVKHFIVFDTLKRKKNKRSRKIQNIIIGAIAIGIIGVISTYYYQVDVENQQGRQFGYELQDIQDELKIQQDRFNARLKQFEDGKISSKELDELSEGYFEKLQQLIQRYEELNPPQPYKSSVELFKQSTKSQLESDKEFVTWLKTGDNQSKIRSDQLLQDSFEYEMAALSDYKKTQRGE